MFYFCFLEGLAWGIWVLVFAILWVGLALVLRWRPFRVSHPLMFPRVRCTLVVQSPGLASLPLGVQGHCLLKLQDLTSHNAKDKFPILVVKATLSSPEYSVKPTPKSSSLLGRSLKLVGRMESVSHLASFQFIVAPKVQFLLEFTVCSPPGQKRVKAEAH